jgi:general secretion pathway protein I
MRQARHPPAHGFGLLEAIVALVLIASTGLALFSWVDTNLAEASRLRERDAASRLQVSAVEFMGSVNPSAEPRGQRDLARMSLSWEATAQGPEAPGIGFTGLPTDYRLQLYDTAVAARDTRSGAATHFTVTLLGYRRAEHAPTTH